MIPFVQFLRPDGREREHRGGFVRPAPIEEEARRLIARGLRFECEVLTTGDVSLTIADPSKGIDVACELVENGPGVEEAVDRLITDYAARLKEEEG